jgi:hypothetical protein
MIIARSLLFRMGIAVILATGFSVGAEKKQSIETRLQRIEDREDIHVLLMNYGRYLDQRDFASFSKLFAEKDGEWIGGMGSAKSPEGIRKLMEESIGGGGSGKGGGPNCHLFLNEIIDITGNEAKGLTKWMFVVQNASKQPQPVYIGHYEDRFIKEQGRWKFLKRVVYGDIPPDDPLNKK